jgi:choline dehydrogenase-like flavoprotein
MAYHRGHPEDFNRWAALGNPGWSYQEVLPFFKRAEHNEHFKDALHGQNGPLNVRFHSSPNPFGETFVEAGVQAGYPACPDQNGATMEGFGRVQVMQKDGQRCSAAKAYLTPNRDRPNLRIETHAHATRIHVRRQTRRGHRVRAQRGKTHPARTPRADPQFRRVQLPAACCCCPVSARKAKTC